MTSFFEIEWLGGVAEKHFRKVRPEVAELPWGTLDAGKRPPALLDAARVRWTLIAMSEYRAALAFSRLLQTLLEARVPLDVVGMASDFVADEVSHVEIASRLAMELGGGAPLPGHPENLRFPASSANDPLARAHEEVLRVCCIHEVLSRAVATDSMRAATHPLIRAAEEIIARDEAMHVRLGSVYFEWAEDLLDEAARAMLAASATDELTRLSKLWLPPKGRPAPDSFTREQVNELGWMDRESQRTRLTRAVREEILPLLESFGVVVEPEAARRLTADIPDGTDTGA